MIFELLDEIRFCPQLVLALRVYLSWRRSKAALTVGLALETETSPSAIRSIPIQAKPFS
jgi:hypothetical protein